MRSSGADASPVTLGVLWGVLRATIAPALMILALLGTMFFGFATPSEASGVGAFGASLLALWNKQLNLKVWRKVVRQTTITTSFIFGILVGASAFALVLRGLGGDKLIEEALLDLDLGHHGRVIAIMVIVFLVGFVLDWIQIVLIVLTLVAPVVKGLGFDLVWFTILFAVCLQTFFLTPPVSLALFYLKGVALPEISTAHIYRGVVPFIIIQLIGLALVYIFPEIATWLPRQAYSQ